MRPMFKPSGDTKKLHDDDDHTYVMYRAISFIFTIPKQYSRKLINFMLLDILY